MKIPLEFYEILRNRINLSDIVRQKVALTKKSGLYVGLCPFHLEKTPSFTVNDTKRFYHCFGCASSGDVIKFVSNISGFSYKEAAIKLAGDYGIELPKITREQERLYNESDQIVNILELATEFFKSQITNEVLTYLKNRGIEQSIIQEFDIGFAPAKGKLQKFFDSRSVPLMMLIKAGLAGKSEDGRIYEIFHNRIIFPIRNIYNKVIGFGGRVIGDGLPKYLNSPETIVFKKSETLYGENKAISAAYKKKYAVIVEGYMDVVALHKAGFNESVASLGTAVTEEHLKKLWRTCDEVVICLDGDAAGIRAAKRSIALILPLITYDKKVSFIRLPANCDPDDVIAKNGTGFFQQLINNRLNLSEMIWHTEYDGKNFITAEDKANLEINLENYAKQISDRTLSANYRRFFKDQIWQNIIKRSNVKGNNARKTDLTPSVTGYSEIERLEYALCSMLVKFPEILEQERVREFVNNINFNVAELKSFCDWFFEEMDKNKEPSIDNIRNIVKKTGFYDTFLLLSTPDNIFLDTSTNTTRTISHILLWELLQKQYYLLSLEYEYKSVIQAGIDEGFKRVALYQEEILKTSQEIQEISESLNEDDNY